jgi:hypothetical protein
MPIVNKFILYFINKHRKLKQFENCIVFLSLGLSNFHKIQCKAKRSFLYFFCFPRFF